MRIKIRTSKWAIWSRRLGSLAVPMLVLPVFLHREQLIASPAFHVVMLAAGLVAALAVFCALIALVRLWFTGDQGWGRALAGLLLGLVCLAPFGWFGYLAADYPLVTDIATTTRSELPLIFEPDTAAMPPPHLLTAEQQARIFPNVTTRTYPLDAFQVFALVERLATAQGWDIRLRREPADATETGRLNARIVTLVGWREEVVIRVMPTATGSAVDMRSASINAVHDFGSNGVRISDFLIALDSEVTAFIRDNRNILQPADDEAAPEVETGSDS